MLFLSDDVNPGQQVRRRVKSTTAAAAAAATAASSAHHQSSTRRRVAPGATSLEQASLLVPSSARPASTSLSPGSHSLASSTDRGNATRRTSTVRRASSLGSSSRNNSAAVTPAPGWLQPAAAEAAAPKRRRTSSHSNMVSDEDDAEANTRTDAAADNTTLENGSAGAPPRDIVIPTDIGRHFHAFADVAEDVVSPAPSHLTTTAAPVSPHSNSSIININAVGDDDDGDSDRRIEYTADEIPSALFIFSGTNRFRVFCLTAIQNWVFHQVILACIVANSVTLAMDQPAVQNPPELATFLTISEYVFTAVFVIECALKVVALGLVLHPHAYLRTPWNVLDFIVVCASIVSLFTAVSNVSALRVVRVLRPLRSVSRIKNLRKLIAGLFSAMPDVVSNLLLLAFLTLVFAIAAVQLWSASLSQRCYVTEFEAGSASLPRYANLSVPFVARNDPEPCGGNHVCPSTYGNDSKMACEIHRDIHRRRNLNYDNFFSASLLVFKVMVFDNWPDDLDDAMNAVGPSAIPFFVVLTLIGGYVCVNLFLAVLTQGYSKAARQMQNEEEMEFADTGAQTDFSSPTELSSEEQAEVNLLVIGAEVRRKREKRKARKAAAVAARAAAEKSKSTSAASVRITAMRRSGARSGSGGGGSDGTSGSRSQSGSPRGGNYNNQASSVSFVATLEDDSASLGARGMTTESIPANHAVDGSNEAEEPENDELRRMTGEMPPPLVSLVGSPDLTATSSVAGTESVDVINHFHQQHTEWDSDDFDFDDDDYEYNPADPRCAMRQLLGWVLVHRFMEIFMMLVTLLNVVVLAIDHYGIDADLAFQLDVISLVCTVIFTIEITVKIFAFGFRCLRNGFNALDFVLVLIALVTITVYGWQAGGSTSAFRALRVFRVFRLLHKFESLQTVIEGIVQSVASIGYLSILILLFLYVWSIMGMQVFGTDYGSGEGSEVRDSFGTFWQSAILSFIVVTGDNWTDKMQVGMSSYSNGLEIVPVAYFVSLYMIGNFILFNLSVAIIVDKLQEKMESIEAKRADEDELPPILIMAPFAIGQMAYRDAEVQQHQHQHNDNSNATVIMSPASDGEAEPVVPTLSQVMAPRTEPERRKVEAALERYNNSGASGRSRSYSIGSLSASLPSPNRGSSLGSQPPPSAPASGTAAPATRHVIEVQSKRRPDEVASSNLIDPAVPPPPDDGGAAPIINTNHNSSGEAPGAFDGAGVPLTEARYVDHLAAEHASATTQCRLFTLYLVSLTVSKPPAVDDDSKSLFCFAPDRPVRRACLYIVGLPLYNGFILLCIIANVVFLTLDGPGASDATLLSILISDYVFAVIFFAEMVIKIIALGGWIEQNDEPLEEADDDDDDDEAEELVADASSSARRQSMSGTDDPRPRSVTTHANDVVVADDDESPPPLIPIETAPNTFAHRRPTKKRPYFRDPWNCIDSFVTLVSIVGLFVPLLKALRALRTIRLVSRIENTRIILVALVQAVPHVMHGLLLSLVVYLVFGILGVQLFKGRLYRCNDPDVELKALCNGTWINQVPGVVFDNPIPTPREWVRTTYHFDHLGAALMTLFVVSIGDGWSEIMFDGMDIVDDEHALKRNNAPWMSLYFIAVFIACNFFAINMMIGILINYFSKKKQEADGSAFLTPKQQQYVKAREIIADNRVGEDLVRTLDNDVSVKISEVITYRHPSVQRISIFDLVMLVFIIVNVVAVATEHDDMDSGLADWLSRIQLGCLIVFTLEMALKWAAYGPWYFTTHWNRFDFGIVVVGWISVGLPAVKFLAFLRVFRVVKLIRDTSVEKLIFMLIRSISSLLHVVTILLLTYFIFAVAGVALFGNVKFNGAINENNNFRTVWSAMLLLYQSATTENWNGVMEAVSVQPPDCDPNRDECGHQAVGTCYFILFMVCCTFVALQLFVAVIVEIFDGDADDSDPIRNAFAEMRRIWIEQFGDETPRVHYTELIEVLPFFPPILTDFPEDEAVSRADMIRLLASLPIPIDSKHYVRYSDLINALAFKKYQVDPRTMGNLVEDAMGSLFVGSAFSMAQVYALDVITDLWMEYKGGTLKHCISISCAKRKSNALAASTSAASLSDVAGDGTGTAGPSK